MVNLSNKILNTDHISLLKRGLKFVPTPTKPDLMILEKDIKEFIRLLKLKEYFYKNNSYQQDNSLVKPSSDFIPNKVKNPVLESVCDTLSHLAENLEHLIPENNYDNLNFSERKALKDLKSDDNIIIKEADKGNVVVILEKSFYKNQMLNTLSDQNIYMQHEKNLDRKIFNKIKKHAAKFYFAGVITSNERKYITNKNYTTANFYGTPKIHKSNSIKNAVKVCNDSCLQIDTQDLKFRGITGCPNSPTTKLSELLMILLKPFISKVKSHVKDTTDFLIKLNRFSESNLDNIILVTVDVVNMYPSIKKDLGLKAIRYFCESYPDLLPNRFSIAFIIESLTIVLDDNLFQFDDKFFTQISGTATGTTVAPIYATLTMAFLENILMAKLAEFYSPVVIKYISENWLRYLDDGFIPWNKKLGDINPFINCLNSLDPDINFTHETNEKEISFLNVRIYKGDKCLLCDIFYKETDTKEYLPFSSCHVRHCKINIPYNLCRTVCTIVEDKNIMYERLEDLKFHLLKSKYPLGVINSAIDKAVAIPQADLRKPNLDKNNSDVIAFVSDFNPKNPNIQYVINNCVSLLKTDPNLNPIFGNIKFINSKREPPSLRSMLTHSRFSSAAFSPGVRKCNIKTCKTCNLIYETNSYNFWRAGIIYKFKDSFDCNTKDCIYVLTCGGCANYYIGKTVNLRNRMTRHRRDVKYDEFCLAYVHKHIDVCGKGEFFTTPFFKVKTKGATAHLSIESFFIRKFKPLLNTLGTV